MFEPIYAAFNFVTWSISTLFWLICWLLIIIAIITFIGFINVQFFTQNNAEFSDILKNERDRSLRFHSAQRRQSSSSSSSSNSEQDTIDAISSPQSHSNSRRSARRKRNRHRQTNKPSPTEIEAAWTVSTRLKTKERRRRSAEQHMHRDETNEDEVISSSAESGRSVSMSVSTTSMSQLKNVVNLSEPTPASLISPDLVDSRNFGFVNHTNMITGHETQSRSQSQSQQTTPKRKKKGEEDGVMLIVFEEEKMKSFDDVYAFIEDVVGYRNDRNEMEMEPNLKMKVQAFVNGGKIELRSFEKAILISKILEL